MNKIKEKKNYFKRKEYQEKLSNIKKDLTARNKKIENINKVWAEEEEEFQKMNPKQKAMKMIRTYCWLAYKGAGNKMSFDEWNSSELAAKIFDKIKNYFRENKTYYCPKKVYQKYLTKELKSL